MSTSTLIKELLSLVLQDDTTNFVKLIGPNKLNYEDTESLLSESKSSTMKRVILDHYVCLGCKYNIALMIMKSKDNDLISYFLNNNRNDISYFDDVMYEISKDVSLSTNEKETIIDLFLSHYEASGEHVVTNCIIMGLMEANDKELLSKYLNGKHKYNLELVTKNNNFRLLLDAVSSIDGLNIKIRNY